MPQSKASAINRRGSDTLPVLLVPAFRKIAPLLITNREAMPSLLLVLVTLAAVGLFQIGLLAATPASTAVVSVALLIFGLPHGAFDIALLRRAGGSSFDTRATLAMVALYLLAAAATYLAWRAAPGPALAAFLTMAVVHFAEDWRACGSRFIAAGIASAIVSAPALLHHDALGALFKLLSGDPRAAVLAELLLLIAPMAVAIAIVGAILLIQARQTALAVALSCTVTALVFLPPVAGFALFFCFVHSPTQFRHHAAELGLHGFSAWRGEVIPITIGGLGVATAVFVCNGGMPVSADFFSSSFMTLAILTVPHMIIPVIAEGFRHPRAMATE